MHKSRAAATPPEHRASPSCEAERTSRATGDRERSGSRARAHAGRARANLSMSIPARARCGGGPFAGFALAGLLAAGLLVAAGCRDANGRPAQPSPAAEARIQEMIETLRPLGKTVTSDITDARFHRGNALVAELSAAGPDVGRAALAALQQQTERDVAVEYGLLRVGARAATADALPLLENLLTNYGPALELRTEAALLLAEVAPERALVLLEPMVLKRKQNQTMPPAEFLVKAWVAACDATGRSPVPELADVATNLFQEDSARVRAVKELGKRPDPLGEKALRAILVESTGNGYLRRMAAQAIRDSLAAERACEVFREVADKEADLNMLQFLADMIGDNCE